MLTVWRGATKWCGSIKDSDAGKQMSEGQTRCANYDKKIEDIKWQWLFHWPTLMNKFQAPLIIVSLIINYTDDKLKWLPNDSLIDNNQQFIVLKITIVICFQLKSLHFARLNCKLPLSNIIWYNKQYFTKHTCQKRLANTYLSRKQNQFLAKKQEQHSFLW